MALKRLRSKKDEYQEAVDAELAAKAEAAKTEEKVEQKPKSKKKK